MATNPPQPEQSHHDRAFAPRAARAAANAAAGQAASFLVLFASAPILGRLLTPEHYGVVGMVTAVTAFVYALRDLGLRRAAVQSRSLSQEQASAVFYLASIIGLAAAALVAALAPALAAFYNEPDVLPITLTLSATFLIAGLTTQHHAILQRNLRFGTIAAIQAAAAISSAAAAITHAALAPSPWALVTMQLVSAAVLALGPAVATRWTPLPPNRAVRNAPIASLISYASWSSIADVLATLQKNADKVIIGRSFGEASLGAYARAYALLLMPIQQITVPLNAVALPTLAKLQDDPQRFRLFYRRGLAAAALAATPLAPFVAATAEPLVLTLLGPNWSPAVPIVLAASPMLLVSATHAATVWPYLALGHVKRRFLWTCISTTAHIAAFLLGAMHSPVHVAAFASITSLALRIPAVLFCFKPTPLTIADFAAPLTVPTLAAVAAAVPVYLLDTLVLADAGLNAPLRLLILAPAYPLLYAGLILATPPGRREVKDALEIANLARKRPTPVAADQRA